MEEQEKNQKSKNYDEVGYKISNIEKLPALIAASVWMAPRMAPPFGDGISLPNPLTTCII